MLERLTIGTVFDRLARALPERWSIKAIIMVVGATTNEIFGLTVDLPEGTRTPFEIWRGLASLHVGPIDQGIYLSDLDAEARRRWSDKVEIYHAGSDKRLTKIPF